MKAVKFCMLIALWAMALPSIAQLSSVNNYQPGLKVQVVIDSLKSPLDDSDESEGGEMSRAKVFETFWANRVTRNDSFRSCRVSSLRGTRQHPCDSVEPTFNRSLSFYKSMKWVTSNKPFFPVS